MEEPTRIWLFDKDNGSFHIRYLGRNGAIYHNNRAIGILDQDEDIFAFFAVINYDYVMYFPPNVDPLELFQRHDLCAIVVPTIPMHHLRNATTSRPIMFLERSTQDYMDTVCDEETPHGASWYLVKCLPNDTQLTAF
jgi:hypothetical protein